MDAAIMDMLPVIVGVSAAVGAVIAVAVLLDRRQRRLRRRPKSRRN